MSEIALVTGATGFIGQALVTHLRASGETVRAAARSSSAHSAVRPNYLITRAIDGETDWDGAVSGADYVVHLAGLAHVTSARGAKSVADFRRVNVDATLNLARQSAANGVRRFVFLSSIKVNGDATAPGRPFTESDAIARFSSEQDPYAWSKWEAERGLLEIADRTKLQVVIIRPPLVYGSGAKANFASLMRVVRHGSPLPFGAIRNRRSFIGIDNLLDFIVTCAGHPAAANETFLVSDGTDLSTPELVELLSSAMRLPARLFPVPVWMLAMAASAIGKGDVIKRLIESLQVDSSKARTQLGWTPPLSVSEGLQRAVKPLRNE
jgi:nucleoside-diphosphate-sugar epimerase